MDLMSLTAVELGKKIQAKEVTVEEAVKAAIASIKAKEEKINSFVTIDEEGKNLELLPVTYISAFLI